MNVVLLNDILMNYVLMNDSLTIVFSEFLNTSMSSILSTDFAITTLIVSLNLVLTLYQSIIQFTLSLVILLVHQLILQ